MQKFVKRLLIVLSDSPRGGSFMVIVLIVGAYYIVTNQTNLKDFAGKLAASVVAVWFATFVIERHFSETMRRVRKLDYSHFIKRMSLSRVEINIIDIWILRLLEGENYKEFQDAIIECVKKGVIVRILVSHPDSDTFKSRASDLADGRLFGDLPKEDVETIMRSKINRLKNIESTVLNTLADDSDTSSIESIKSRLQFRMYNGSIDFSMYQVDDVRYIGTHPEGGLSTDNKQVKAAGGLFEEYFRAQFERRWAIAVSLSTYS